MVSKGRLSRRKKNKKKFLLEIYVRFDGRIIQNGSIVLYSTILNIFSIGFEKAKKRVLRKKMLLTSLGMGNAIDQALESQKWHIQWGIEMVEYRLR